MKNPVREDEHEHQRIREQEQYPKKYWKFFLNEYVSDFKSERQQRSILLFGYSAFFRTVLFSDSIWCASFGFCKNKSCRMRQDSTIKTHEFTLKTQRILSCKSCRHQGVNATSRDRLKDCSYFIRLAGGCQGIQQSILQSFKN